VPNELVFHEVGRDCWKDFERLFASRGEVGMAGTRRYVMRLEV